MISSSRRWLQNARTLLSLAHQPLRCCSPSSTPSQQRLRRVLLWQSRRLEIDFEKMFDLVSISAREGKLGLEKNSRKTPHCPASINARDVSSRMAACLLVGRQRTASRTVGTSSSFACSVDAIRDQPLWSSSSSRMVAEAPCCEWPDAWWTGSEIAESVPSRSSNSAILLSLLREPARVHTKTSHFCNYSQMCTTRLPRPPKCRSKGGNN